MLLRMARRYTVLPARNDPDWGAGVAARSCRASTDNVEPLRTRAGECHAGIGPEIVKAWYFRRLRSEGAPASPAVARAAIGG